MPDASAPELRIRSRSADGVVAGLHGELTSTSTPEMHRPLTKLLLAHPRVVLDISQARLSWAPAPELFVSAVAAAGGWPAAQLVLVGADWHTTQRLRACRVSESVPLAATEQDAVALFGQRPARLMRSERFPDYRSSVARARQFVENVCRLWDIPDPYHRATVIVGELADNAVRHARTSFQLRLVLDRGRLRISVRDGRPGPLPTVARHAEGPRLSGLARVDALSDSWGGLQYEDGKAIWALLEATDQALPAEQRRDIRHGHRRSPATVAARGGRAEPRQLVPVGSTTTVQRRHFLSFDVEQAHEFIDRKRVV